jgi:hypothetical protein
MVGQYQLFAGNITNTSGNFSNTIVLTAPLLTIKPATLAYVARAVNSVYGTMPSVNAGAANGFVSGENLSNATTGTLTFTTDATASSAVGSYAIIGSGLTANNGNYNFTQAASNSTALTISLPPPSSVTNSASVSAGSLQTSLNDELARLSFEMSYGQSDGSVTVSPPIQECAMKYEGNFISCVQ